MRKIEKYIENGDRLAAVLCDLYDRFSTVTIASVPVGGVPGYYGFGVSVDNGEFDNSIFIDEHCYQLTETDDRDRCENCALRDCCGGDNPKPCEVFKNEPGASGYHFEKAKIY